MRPLREITIERFAIGLALDRLWNETMGHSVGDKSTVLLRLVQVLDSAGTPYALIGGVAVQLYVQEPRTTLDLDIAVRARSELPREALTSHGFQLDGVHEWSENWLGPAPDGSPRRLRTPVQFTTMPEIAERGELTSLGDFSVRVATVKDLVELKLVAIEDPSRRPTKRLHDKADVLQLLEEHPDLATEEIQKRLDRMRF